MTPVRLELAASLSQDKHSITEPMRSAMILFINDLNLDGQYCSSEYPCEKKWWGA